MMELQPSRDTALEVPTQEALRHVATDGGEPRLSLYLAFPRHPGFDDLRGLPRRYASAVDAAAERMAALGVPDGERRALIEPLRTLELAPSALPPLARGVAVLASPARMHAFGLPIDVADSVRVARGYHLRPLLAAARLATSFRVLAVATNQVALFEGDARGLRRVTGEGVPASLEDALGSELSSASLQAHSSASGGGAPIFHGQGGASAAREADRERFHRVLADSVARLWNGREDPLVLAADESHQGHFRHATALRGLLAAGIHGSPERMQVTELFERARELVQGLRMETDRAAARRAAHGLAHGAAVDTLEAALAAAVAGRVLRLWLAPDAQVARHVEPETGALADPWGDDEALDELAELVLARGGWVLVDTANVLERTVVAELRG